MLLEAHQKTVEDLNSAQQNQQQISTSIIKPYVKTWIGPGLSPLGYSEHSPKGKSRRRTLIWPQQKLPWKLSIGLCQLHLLDYPFAPEMLTA